MLPLSSTTGTKLTKQDLVNMKRVEIYSKYQAASKSAQTYKEYYLQTKKSNGPAELVQSFREQAIDFHNQTQKFLQEYNEYRAGNL